MGESAAAQRGLLESHSPLNRLTAASAALRPPPAPVARPVSDPVLVRLRLIGQMEAWTLTSESILPTGRKTRALLAVMALSSPRPVPGATHGPAIRAPAPSGDH